MELRIDRYQFSKKSTIGRMYINGSFFCYSLEDTLRIGEKKVYGQTAIPDGKYKVVLYKSTHFNRMLPLLQDVPGFTGIYIHIGNTSAKTDGCILVGRTCRLDYIGNCEMAIDDLVKKISAVIANEPVYITIRNILKRETGKPKTATA